MCTIQYVLFICSVLLVHICKFGIVFIEMCIILPTFSHHFTQLAENIEEQEMH